jgi:hypothetical protein
MRRRLASILPRRGADFLQGSLNSSLTHRVGSIEIVPCTSDEPQNSPSRREQKYTSMTGQLTIKGKTFWSRGESATPSSSEVESLSASPYAQETQTESKRPQSLDLPGPSQARLNPTSEDGSRTNSEESQHPTAAERERYEALAVRIREVLGNGENGALGPHEDITPITERAEDNCDPWTVFSVISNGKKIFRFEDSSVKLQSLYGIKFLSVCWVLIGHMCLVAESLPAMNYVAIRDVSTSLNP